MVSIALNAPQTHSIPKNQDASSARHPPSRARGVRWGPAGASVTTLMVLALVLQQPFLVSGTCCARCWLLIFKEKKVQALQGDFFFFLPLQLWGLGAESRGGFPLCGWEQVGDGCPRAKVMVYLECHLTQPG